MAKVVKGKTDLWTTSPQIAQLLLNPEDGYKLSLESHKKADFLCPNCNTIINKVVRSINRHGFKCPCCSDGISYPEKFVSNLFNQLGVRFLQDTSLPWSDGKRYDFYVKDMSLIIEAHGMQHYSEEAMFSKANGRSEKDNDEYKMEIALNNGIKHYVVLDCRYSDFDYIKRSVLDSELNTLYDLSFVDWNILKIDCFKSKVIEACDLYNSGIKNTSKIAEALKLDRTTVIEYLLRSASAGMCDYTTDRRKKIICVDTGKVYDSLKSVKDDGFNTSQVSECCNGNGGAKTAGGYNWCFYDEYNPDTYVMKKPSNDNTPKRVLCIETGKVYERLSYVTEDGYASSAVSQVCNGKLKMHKGLHFKFI